MQAFLFLSSSLPLPLGRPTPKLSFPGRWDPLSLPPPSQTSQTLTRPLSHIGPCRTLPDPSHGGNGPAWVSPGQPPPRQACAAGAPTTGPAQGCCKDHHPPPPPPPASSVTSLPGLSGDLVKTLSSVTPRQASLVILCTPSCLPGGQGHQGLVLTSSQSGFRMNGPGEQGGGQGCADAGGSPL